VRRPILIITLFLLYSIAHAQIFTARIEKLPLPTNQEWAYPVFSPDGKKIYFTNSSYNGIWEYTLTTNKLRQITDAPGSGYGFSFSDDGSQLVYRKTTYDEKTRERTQELYQVNLKTLLSKKIAAGSDISNPTFVKSNVVFSSGFETKNLENVKLSSNETKVIGIENTKIVILHNGERKVLDPFGNGSYIWPSLSPDKTKLVAYEADRGAFVCDLNGNILAKLGRVDAPVWTRDGKYIIYMDDKDDGHFILSSEIMAITPDGKEKYQLTSTPNVIEMYPHTSPIENKIVCSSLSGEIFIIHYNYGERKSNESEN
jgi:Tol biopolymer transport system component